MNWHYLYLLFQSNLLEVIVFAMLYYKRISLTRIVLLVSISNAITHPIVIFGFLRSSHVSFLVGIVMAELFAIFVEAAFHSQEKNISSWAALKASTLANLVSWQIGPVLTTLIFMRDKLQ